MKLLILLATSLLFYTQATEEKMCIKEYRLTDSEAAFLQSQAECKKKEGTMASEDLNDSENAAKARSAVNAFRGVRDNENKNVWLGIAVDDITQPSDKNSNYFVLSDESEFDDTNFAFKWKKNDMGVDHPDYSNTKRRCSVLYDKYNKMSSVECSDTGYGLCVYEKCEKENEDENEDETEGENSANSQSENSRANLQLFALFMACSVFKTFYALVGMDF